MKDTIKKYWFVGLVGVFLFAGLIYLATDTLQTSVKAKQTEVVVVDQANVKAALVDSGYYTEKEIK